MWSNHAPNAGSGAHEGKDTCGALGGKPELEVQPQL